VKGLPGVLFLLFLLGGCTSREPRSLRVDGLSAELTESSVVSMGFYREQVTVSLESGEKIAIYPVPGAGSSVSLIDSTLKAVRRVRPDAVRYKLDFARDNKTVAFIATSGDQGLDLPGGITFSIAGEDAGISSIEPGGTAVVLRFSDGQKCRSGEGVTIQSNGDTWILYLVRAEEYNPDESELSGLYVDLVMIRQ
jgi:hypothetical protein